MLILVTQVLRNEFTNKDILIWIKHLYVLFNLNDI